uniref:Predicted protein n=1 Tax=Physcomitrium patens TaxID=3218 RepID=A9U6H2_PHYPA
MEGGNLDSASSGVGRRASFGGQGMHFDPNSTSMFEALTLFMQQQEQQVKDRKESMANKPLQAVVDKIDQFEGKDITKYLRYYVKEMELKRISESEMVQLFELASAREIRNQVKFLIQHFGGSWEKFSQALKDKFFLEDSDRVTKRSFFEWIEKPKKDLLGIELLRKFEKQYSSLSKKERQLLDPKDVVRTMTKREKRKDMGGDQRPLQPSKIKMSSIHPTSLIQPSMATSKKEETGIDEMIRWMRDL